MQARSLLRPTNAHTPSLALNRDGESNHSVTNRERGMLTRRCGDSPLTEFSGCAVGVVQHQRKPRDDITIRERCRRDDAISTSTQVKTRRNTVRQFQRAQVGFCGRDCRRRRLYRRGTLELTLPLTDLPLELVCLGFQLAVFALKLAKPYGLSPQPQQFLLVRLAALNRRL